MDGRTDAGSRCSRLILYLLKLAPGHGSQLRPATSLVAKCAKGSPRLRTWWLGCRNARRYSLTVQKAKLRAEGEVLLALTSLISVPKPSMPTHSEPSASRMVADNSPEESRGGIWGRVESPERNDRSFHSLP